MHASRRHLLTIYTPSKRIFSVEVGGKRDVLWSEHFLFRQIQQRFRQTITSARFGGPVEATKRILAQLPISAQSFSASPYLDQALFSYDDHRVSVMERPKACGEIPIRFYGRDSGVFKFQIHAGILVKGNSHTGRRLVAFTFHPSAPFGISVQRANSEYLVNFHFRYDRGAN
jgi:de-etiolated-1